MVVGVAWAYAAAGVFGGGTVGSFQSRYLFQRSVLPQVAAKDAVVKRRQDHTRINGGS